MDNNLRYRYARDEADRLGQIFTPESVANLLIKSLPSQSTEIKRIIDIGAGQGALTLAALRRYPNSSALLIEIDSNHVNKLNAAVPKNVNIISGDALALGWENTYKADIVVSNPNYGMLLLNDSIKTLLSTVNINIPLSGEWIRGDAAFVARAWMCLSKGASLGLIVASPIIRDSAFKELRKKLIGELSELCITQLDTHVFTGAEVQAFLITGLRSSSKKRRVLLRKASLEGAIQDELEISWEEAINRLDFDYYKTMTELGISASTTSDTLASVGTSIVRGSKSNNDFQNLGLNAFHTTNFKEFSGELVIDGEISTNYKTAQSGDILIPRVGSRCLNNQAKVVRGKGYFTDCVYRLTSKPQVRDQVWKTISSSFGTEWRLAHASGNCAKHLTVNTLLDMPLLS